MNILILITAGLLIIPFAGRLLVVNEKPRPADVIIVLSGDRGDRVERGVVLYQQGLAKKIILTGGEVYRNIVMADLMANHAAALGVESQNIIRERKADNTWENAVFTKEIMEQNNFNSAIVVSSTYHMRRVKMVFEKIFEGSNIKLTYCAAEHDCYEPARWWETNNGLLVTVNEYLKMAGYVLQLNS